jgi:hypothetical protein
VTGFAASAASSKPPMARTRTTTKRDRAKRIPMSFSGVRGHDLRMTPTWSALDGSQTLSVFTPESKPNGTVGEKRRKTWLMASMKRQPGKDPSTMAEMNASLSSNVKPGHVESK